MIPSAMPGVCAPVEVSFMGPGFPGLVGVSDFGSAVKRWSPGNCRTFGRKGAMSILTLNDCPACGLVETKTGGHPRCPDCGRRLGCEEPPERGDYDYDEAP